MFEVNFHYSWLPGQLPSKSGEAQLFAMLDGIHREGSLRAAVTHAGMSYRYAWGLIGRWEKLFGQKLVIMQRGRGTKLTALGEKLLWAQRRVQARLAPQIQTLSAELERELALVLDSDTANIRITASHDLALAALKESLAKAGGPRLDLRFAGSETSLAALLAGECDVAGFHVSASMPAEVQSYRERLNPKRFSVVRFVTRSQGLMMAAANPLAITDLKSLTRKKVRFINRQAGSGTRASLDHLLSQRGIQPAQLNGYEREEYTHLAVAATIASGQADAGLGIEAAARQFNLGYQPLFEEEYFFACRNDFLDAAAMRQLLAHLSKTALRNQLRKLPGYAADHLGEVAAPGAALLPAATTTPPKKKRT